MPVVRAELDFNMFTDWDGDEFAPADRHEQEANAMLDDLEETVRLHRG